MKEERDALKKELKVVYDSSKKLVNDISKLIDWPF